MKTELCSDIGVTLQCFHHCVLHGVLHGPRKIMWDYHRWPFSFALSCSFFYSTHSTTFNSCKQPGSTERSLKRRRSGKEEEGEKKKKEKREQKRMSEVTMVWFRQFPWVYVVAHIKRMLTRAAMVLKTALFSGWLSVHRTLICLLYFVFAIHVCSWLYYVKLCNRL